MDDIWKRAKALAEEAAKKSQTITTSSSHKFADLVAETAKRSKELVLEASKKSDEIKAAALKQADQIKSFSDIIPPQLSSLVSSADNSSSSTEVSESELRRFGVTDDLRDFVKGLTPVTFQSFLVQDEGGGEETEVETTASNVRKDLTEWQERHATIVLSSVKTISRLRYDLCPRVMKERRFWRIYFTLVGTHVAPYEKQYMEEIKRKAEEQTKDDKAKQSTAVGEASSSETMDKNVKSGKTSTAASAEQDLDTYLLGDPEDSDGYQDDGDGSFDDDFDKIGNSDIDEDKNPKKETSTTE